MIKFLKFNIIGIINTCVDFAVFFILFEILNINLEISQVLSYSAGLLNSYIMNKRFTFKNQTKSNAIMIIKFLLVNMVSLIFSVYYIKFFVGIYPHMVFLGKASSTIITMLINYFGNSLWTFKECKGTEGSANVHANKGVKIMKKWNPIICIAILLLIGVVILNFPSPIGLADNSDYERVIQPIGLTSNTQMKYFYFQQTFDYIHPFDSLSDHIRFIFNPNIENLNEYESTHFILVKIAQVINGIISYFQSKSISKFDVRVLGTLYLIIHCLALYLMGQGLKIGRKWIRYLPLLIISFIYLGDSYLVYYNSFFGEAVVLVSFLTYFATLSYMIKKKEASYIMLISHFLAAVIFIGAKVANIPLGVLIAIYSIGFFTVEKQTIKRIVIVIGIIAIILTSVHYYNEVPDWMSDVNQYHSLFFGVLKDAQDPIKDLEELGIDTKYAVLANTHGYMYHNGYNIYSDEFREEVYEHAKPLDISLFYLKHPKRFYEKLKKSAEASLAIRPPYLGNYTYETSNEVLKFSSRFSLWEDIRKQFLGNGLLMIVIVFVAFMVMLVYRVFKMKLKEKDNWSLLDFGARTMLLLFSATQFVIPIIGNGEADLIKHMFLFNVLFDMMIILLVIDLISFIIHLRIKKHILYSSVAVLVIVVTIFIFTSISKNNELITFGKYNGKNIVWEIVDETEDYYLIVANDIITNRAFSSNNSNMWVDSELRIWLNSDHENGFLEEFTNEEKNRIIPTQLKTVVAPEYIEFIESGHLPLYWFSVPGYATQNYSEAYSRMDEERVFLLSIEEWEKFNFDKDKNENYWLRTPYTISKIVRTVGRDGFIYHKAADMKSCGVLPAMYIKKD